MLIRKLITGSVFVIAVSSAPLLASAGQPEANEKQMASLQYLIGSWHCDWQSGEKSGSEDQVFQPALDGAWLEEKELITVNGRRTVASIHYTGFDPRTNVYMHMGPDANGSYEVAQSPDSENWQSSDGSFVHHKVSGTQRTMTESYRYGNTTVVLSMRCTKV